MKKREPQNSKLTLINDTFENIKLEEYSLVLENMSLFFCEPKCFKDVYNKILNSIIKDGYFVGNFLGEEDEWSKDIHRTFINEKDLKEMFKDFEILYFKEKKFDKKTARGNMKFWHVYELIAKK